MAFFLCAGTIFADVFDPHFATDRSVDTRSAKTIVRGLIKPGMSKEEKALAIFHWLRRVIFHSGPEDPRKHDFNKMINVFGCGSCALQTHPLGHLFHQVGFPSRSWMHDGHHMLEVYYDGRWHCFDPHMTFYVYNRENPRGIASIEELRRDPTLARDALEEHRTGPAFMICGDSTKWFAGDTGWVQEGRYQTPVGADQEFGSVHLRRGETYVRTWKAGRFYSGQGFAGGFGPYHTCGPSSDRRDPINFPYWEPYLWQDRRSSYRHFGTGYLDYAPDLRRGGWQAGAVQFTNLASDTDGSCPALHPISAELEGEVIFSVRCPYILAGASVELGGQLDQSGDLVQVAVSKEWVGKFPKRRWVDLLEVRESGPFKRSANLTSAVEGSTDGYWLRLRLQAQEPRKTGLNVLKLHTDFQLNPYVLPQLLPGKNKIMVTAERCDTPWKFRLTWQEGENWQVPREYKARIEGTAHEAMVEVAGPKFPRMQVIEFSVTP